MPFDRLGPLSRLNRRTFLTRAGWTGVGATALVAGADRKRAFAQAGPRTPTGSRPAPSRPSAAGC